MFYRISSLERDCISVRQFAVYEFSILSVIPDRWLWIRIWRVVIVYVLHAACIIKCGLCAKCSFRKKTVFVRICFCMHPLFTHPKNSVKSASCKSFWQIFPWRKCRSVIFRIWPQSKDQWQDMPPNIEKFVKWKVMTSSPTLPCSLSSVKFEVRWGAAWGSSAS